MANALAPSTRQQYQQSLDKCLNYIRDDLHQRPVLPLSTEQIHMYIAYLHTQKYKHTTILTHLSAISHFHKIGNHPDPTANYATSKILTGVRNSQGHQPDPRQPITRNILHGLLTALHSCTINRNEHLLYRSMFTLMYYACLRASEVLTTETPQHIIQLSQLSLQSNHRSYELKFSSYKHSTNEKTSIFITATSPVDCPVAALSKYIASRGHTAGPLYILSGRTLTRHQFTKMLHQCLNYINQPAPLYNIHSFRIGRTTDMALENIPHSTIQHIGRWKSTAYMKYIRPQCITTNPSTSAAVF